MSSSLSTLAPRPRRRPILMSWMSTPSTPSSTASMDDASVESVSLKTVNCFKAKNVARRYQRTRQRVCEAAEKADDMDLGASGLATTSATAGRK